MMDLQGSTILRCAGLLVMSLLLLTTISCDDEGKTEDPTVPVDEVPPTVTVMPATSVGTTYATLNATIERGKNYGIIETGFVFFDPVDSPDSLVIPVSSQNTDLSHKMEELQRNITYGYKVYVKAYAYSAKNSPLYFVSTVMQFTTANPDIILSSIYPEEGTAGMTVTISASDLGAEFEPLTVKFDGIEARILGRVMNQLSIRVVVPEGLTERLVNVSLTVGSTTVEKPDFFNLMTGNWEQLGDGPSVNRGLFTFTVYDRVYVGFEDDPALYMYNAATDAWTKKDNYPEGTICAFAPEDSPFVLTSDNEVFFYDYMADGWSSLEDMTFPGVKRKSAVAFVVDSRPYVGLGRNDTTVFTDLWQYAPAHEDKWIRMEDFPGEPVRSYGNTLAFGAEGYAYIYNNPELWIYTPSTNSWTLKADFPMEEVFGPRGFLLNNELYLGSTGGYVWFYVFDQVKNKWARVNGIPTAKIHPFAFSIGGKGYVGAGSRNINGQVTDKSVLMFTP